MRKKSLPSCFGSYHEISASARAEYSCHNCPVAGRCSATYRESGRPISFKGAATKKGSMPTRRPKVYLIAQPSPDTDKLQKLSAHGEVVTVIRAGDTPSQRPDKCLALVLERMQGFDPEVDYLAWAGGDSLAALMAGLYIERMGFHRVQWLKYDRPKLPNGQRTEVGAKYVPVWLNIYQKAS